MSGVLEGERVRLRPIDEDDAPLVVRWRSAPHAAPWMFRPAPTEAEHRDWVRRLRSTGGRLEYVVLRREDGLAIGTAGLAQIEAGQRRAEFGVLIGEPEAGAGRAVDAGRTLLKHAFGSLDLDRVYLHTFADNARACRFFTKLGFRDEGILRGHALKDGLRRDVRVMGLLRQDWSGG